MVDDNVKISDQSFKSIIAASLPHAWDGFAERYVEHPISSQEFIEILKPKRSARERPIPYFKQDKIT